MMGWYTEIKGQDVGLDDRDYRDRYNFQLDPPARWTGQVPKNLIQASDRFERRSEFGIVLRDSTKKKLKIRRHVVNRYDGNVAEEIPIKQWPVKLKVGNDTVYRFRAAEEYDWTSFSNSCLARPGSITVLGRDSDSVLICTNYGPRVWYVSSYVKHGNVLTKSFKGKLVELKLGEKRWIGVIDSLPTSFPPFRPLPVMINNGKQHQKASLVKELNHYRDPKVEKLESPEAKGFVKALLRYYEVEFKEPPKFKVDQAVCVEFEPFPFR